LGEVDKSVFAEPVLAKHCIEENKKGTPFRFHELPPNHLARLFTRGINPEWERDLPRPRE
jgi:hypothetical protein